MENLPALQNHSVSFKQQMFSALEGKKIVECIDNEEIKQALRYGLMLLGIPESKYGDELSKAVLIDYLSKTYPNVRLNELKLAFDFAVAKTTIANTTLYQGEFVSAKFISEIISAYLTFKKENKIVKIGTLPTINMNNIERIKAIIPMLSEETKEHIETICKRKPERTDLPPLPYHDIHQRWMRQFDWLYKHFPVKEKGKKFIRRSGFVFDMDEFFNYKALQMARVKAYLLERNTDKI